LTKDKLPDGLTRPSTNEKVIGEDSKRFLKKFNGDRTYSFIAVYKYLKTIGKLEMVVMNKSAFPDLDRLEENYKAISLSKVEEIFTQEDWDNLLNEYYKIKKESVEVLIDSFVNPEDYKIAESNLQFREQLISEVERRLVNNQL
jgi:hypothetical protein